MDLKNHTERLDSKLKSATEIEEEIGFEYSYKLKLDDAVIPGPYSITDGWKSSTLNRGNRARNLNPLEL